MARTGPQKIPGALLDLFFGDSRYSGSDMEVNTGLLHTTEGATLVDYDSGAVAPNVTLVPDFAARRLVAHQHYDVDESARALVNAPGGVQTNTLNVFQIELVGTCDPATHARWTSQGVQHIYWPDPPDWAVRDLAWLMRWLHDEHGIPLTGVAEWMPYPASYGATRVRMSFDQWTNFSGWCGHQHAPENVHGDPGALPFARFLAVATGAAAPTPNASEEDPMPYTLEQIAGAVWDQPIVDVATGAKKTPATVMAWMDKVHNTQTEIVTRQIAATTAAITALATQLGQVHGVDTDTVVAAVKEAIADAVVDVNVSVTSTPKG